MQSVFMEYEKEDNKVAEMVYQKGITCIVMDEKDNVATLLADVKQGATVIYTKGNQTYELTLQQDINFGHKVAITHINKAEQVMKYGEVIGAASTTIQPGEHVHIHNIEGIRGRGDKKEGSASV